MTETVVVIDFETTGLSPDKGARATEVAAVRVVGDTIADHFQSLMNSGKTVPPEIERLTGITNAMLRHAPPARQVMGQLLAFVGNAPLVAHNAKFDEAFFAAECRHAGHPKSHRFACTLLLAKRVYPRAPNYKLQTILDYADIPYSGRFHRALADATATAQLWVQMQSDLCARHGIPLLLYPQLRALTGVSVAKVESKIESWKKSQSHPH